MSPHISLYLPISPRAFEQAGRVLPQRPMSALLEAEWKEVAEADRAEQLAQQKLRGCSKQRRVWW